jgi:hypothetical protein
MEAKNKIFESLGFSEKFIKCIEKNKVEEYKIESDDILNYSCEYENQLDITPFIIHKTDEPICNIICR